MGKIICYPMLWNLVCEYAKKVSRAAARQILQLFFVLKSDETPMSEKILVYSAIAYLVLPVDLISAKRLPVIGWIDELVSLTVAYQKVKKYVTPEIERRVEDILDHLIPMASYEVAE